MSYNDSIIDTSIPIDRWMDGKQIDRQISTFPYTKVYDYSKIKKVQQYPNYGKKSLSISKYTQNIVRTTL